jgi:predicted RNA-binding protein
LKKRIIKLEVTLNPNPLFTQPISIKAYEEHLKDTPRKIAKTRKAQELLQGVKKIIMSNIKDRVNVLSEVWELVNKSYLTTRSMSLSEPFHHEFQND